ILAVALYPLHSNNSVLLTFEKGDKLIIEDDSDPDWYLARHLNDQRRGFAPKSYLVQDAVGNPETRKELNITKKTDKNHDCKPTTNHTDHLYPTHRFELLL
ncbi:SH3 domain-containing protein, partial [Trichonephila inaurata madagascariensis]